MNAPRMRMAATAREEERQQRGASRGASWFLNVGAFCTLDRNCTLRVAGLLTCSRKLYAHAWLMKDCDFLLLPAMCRTLEI
eukprot:3388475-Pleurochrysis_carterae.AAC.1